MAKMSVDVTRCDLSNVNLASDTHCGGHVLYAAAVLHPHAHDRLSKLTGEVGPRDT